MNLMRTYQRLVAATDMAALPRSAVEPSIDAPSAAAEPRPPVPTEFRTDSSSPQPVTRGRNPADGNTVACPRPTIPRPLSPLPWTSWSLTPTSLLVGERALQVVVFALHLVETEEGKRYEIEVVYVLSMSEDGGQVEMVE
ncbi:hypothetical protein LTR62_002902 [Meristemomyces frigidus]|uniref:Uncharacterized protein n=1 Tax=Meristemomyces frigidus TaxID=1508187 RepID=A0AAN7TS05_9PEZI|nr:hypothetical protein LTR62_002902 [Meristemomyces frigidus]